MKKFTVVSKNERSKPHFMFSIRVSNGSDIDKEILVGKFYEHEPENQLIMSDLAETLERMKAAYPNGKRGMDGYSKVEGYKRWFVGMIDEFYENLETHYAQEFYEEYEWPCDRYGNSLELMYYEVYYVDNFERKHQVIIED